MSERRYVVGFLFTPDEMQVALVMKTRPAWQVGKLNGIGGHVDEGESFGDAMVREFREEAGVTLLGGWTRFAVLSNANDHAGGAGAWEMHCYRASEEDAAYQVAPISDVGERINLYPVEMVASGMLPTIPNLRWLVPMAHPNDAHDWPYRITERAHLSPESAP